MQMNLFTFHYVYIYILGCFRDDERVKRFTFHYVYIYMPYIFANVRGYYNLHSTMFIFICYCRTAGKR